MDWYLISKLSASAADRGVPALGTKHTVLTDPDREALLGLLRRSRRVRPLVTPDSLHVADWNEHTHQTMAHALRIPYEDAQRGYIGVDSYGQVYWDHPQRDHPQARRLGFSPEDGIMN